MSYVEHDIEYYIRLIFAIPSAIIIALMMCGLVSTFINTYFCICIQSKYRYALSSVFLRCYNICYKMVNRCGFENPLEHLIIYNELSTFNKVYSSGFTSVNTKDRKGQSLIHLASERGYEHFIHILARCGCTMINNCDNKGLSPLDYAIINRNISIISTLVLYGAELNKHLLITILKNNEYKILRVLFLHFDLSCVLFNKNESMVFLAASYGHLKIIKILVKYGYAMITTRNDDGLNPLHIAAARGHINIIEYLSSIMGSQCEQLDNHRRTPLFYALHYNEYHCAYILKILYGTKDTYIDTLPNMHVEFLDAHISDEHRLSTRHRIYFSRHLFDMLIYDNIYYVD